MKRSLAHREALTAYSMILPWVIGFLVFSMGPTLATAYISLTEYNVLKPPEFVGTDNYAILLRRDPLFWQSLYNTAYYVVFSVPLRMMLAFILAYFLNSGIHWAGVYRTLFYLPYIVPSVAASVLWLWLLNRRFGLINYGLGLLSLPPISWLGSETWSKPALILLSLWSIGGLMVIYLASLQSISQELYEAVQVDGGTRRHSLMHITLPLMTPTFFFTLVLGVIGSFQAFEAAFVTTNGGPVNSTLFYMLHIYNRAFRDFDMGYASALAWVLFVLVLILTILLFRGSRFWVYYEGEPE
jgi:multiple sugar transport system permease protein